MGKKKVLGEEHLETITSYNNLGVLYSNLGKYEEAHIFYLKALKIREKVVF